MAPRMVPIGPQRCTVRLADRLSDQCEMGTRDVLGHPHTGILPSHFIANEHAVTRYANLKVIAPSGETEPMIATDRERRLRADY